MSVEVTPVRQRVLVIDDEPSLARALCRLLNSEYEVTYSTRATDALKRLHDGERFDAILCDVQMPGMTGLELYEQLTNEQPAQADRMMFLSGHEAPDDDARASARWLHKPPAPGVLRAVLRDFLQSARAV